MDRLFSEADCQALRQYIAQAVALLPDQIQAIIVFGSKARGDSTSDSDVDLMIVLQKDTLIRREQLRSFVFDILLETGVYLSTQILSDDLFQQLPVRRPLFYANLIRDGILLYARPDAKLPEFTKRLDLIAAA